MGLAGLIGRLSFRSALSTLILAVSERDATAPDTPQLHLAIRIACCRASTAALIASTATLVAVSTACLHRHRSVTAQSYPPAPSPTAPPAAAPSAPPATAPRQPVQAPVQIPPQMQIAPGEEGIASW